ncbi:MULTISPECIES: cell division protein FtsA [unclassified Granulicatella]|uniref:cell division protein FtsA n=1 Tax=unclassified Granulicatella TaxID=2630493 RepID=UPI0010732535|nr:MULTISPECIES: cell division protein FtsA [unclassified Granulicatella]MBF0780418.1 cell division protein FtsA [Granulicatella sp. 19428wC4_WM01]TFU95454.1 cell division protein FtsA [Granulicatella sp. WM01]
MVEKSVHVSLDIGTSTIKVIVSEFARNQLNVIGVGVEPTNNGVSRGIIVDIDATVSAIKKAVYKAEQRANVIIKNVVVGVPSNQITVEPCQGMIAVSSENREITNKDVDNVISAAKVRSVPPEREIISILPEEFIVDGFDGIRDPRGMIGVRLELFAHLITGPKTIIHNIRRCVEKAGLTISEMVLQPLANSKVALSAGERSFGTVLIDMGGGQTSVSVIHDDQVKFAFIDQQGGHYVTKDISTVLNTTLENAEMLKREFGYARVADITQARYIPVETVGQKDPIRVEEGYLAEIIEARLVQTFENVKRALNSVDALSLPGGVVLTGGAALIPGIVELAEDIFNVPVKLYVPEQMGLRHPSYTQALGLVHYTVNLDEIHHFAQLDSTQKQTNTNQTHVVSERKERPTPPKSEQVQTEKTEQTKSKHETSTQEETVSHKKGSFFNRIGDGFKNFLNGIGEE